MNPNTIREWLVPVSTAFALIPIAVGAWLSLREYRLKLQAETRLKNSSRVEQDIQLLTLFTEIMNLAHARGGAQVSEKAVELILKPEIVKELAPQGKALRDLLDNAVVVLPVGVAQQDAAIAAIWALGQRHELLRPVAIQALESLMSFKGDVAGKYLDSLRTIESQPHKQQTPT
jgi:hypothetical protein